MPIEKDDLIPYLEGLFETACLKLFERMDQEIVRVEAAGKVTRHFSSKIYSVSDQLSVSLLLVMPCQIIEDTLPMISDPPENMEEIERDWVLELSNQMLGRFKNKLLAHDCVLKMGLPALTDEIGSEAESTCNGTFIPMFFAIRHDVLECYLCIRVKDTSLSLVDHEDEDEDWFSESELEHL